MKNVSYVPYSKFDAGRYPSIAVNVHGTVIEGHQRQLDSNIYYNVGTAGNDMVNFNINSGIKFDAGAPPRFALNDNNWAVEVHKSNGPSDKLWFHAGQVNPSNKTWAYGSSQHDGNGYDPDIAINNSNQVINVYQDNGKIKCRLGTVNTSKKEIKFNSAIEVATGKTPTVAMTDSGKVVVVYDDSQNNLYYWIGQISGTTVTKKGSATFGSGSNPSVGLTESGFVMLGYAKDGDLYGKAGTLNETNITWQTAYQYAYGNFPWVDVKGNYAVQVFPSDDFADYSLFASLSTIANRANWMSANPKIQALPLNKLVMPGSHDAGMSSSSNGTIGVSVCNTRTQYIEIGGQLEMGCRYFDIRPTMYKGQFMTGHYSGTNGANGQSLDSVLSQASAFVDGQSNEVVVLKFSHYTDRDAGTACFSQSTMNNLVSSVKSALGNRIFVMSAAQQSTYGRVANIPLSEITSNGSKIITIFQFVPNKKTESGDSKNCTCEDDSGPLCVPYSNSPDPSSGIYGYADYCPACPPIADFTVYDQYASTNNLGQMISNQWGKLGDVRNHGGDLFLLSWTLTQSVAQAGTCTFTWADSIIAIAGTADAKLYSECIQQVSTGLIAMDKLPNILYVDLCNGFATDVAIYLNSQLGAK